MTETHFCSLGPHWKTFSETFQTKTNYPKRIRKRITCERSIRLLHPYFAFSVASPASWKYNYTSANDTKMTTTRICTVVRNKEYRSTED